MTRTGRRTLAAADEGPSPPGNAPTGPHLPLSVAASDAAPFVYFDSAANYGLHNGVAQITLEARRTLSTEAGLVAERVVVAHLRMSVAAAMNLRAALDGLALLAAPQAGRGEH